MDIRTLRAGFAAALIVPIIAVSAWAQATAQLDGRVTDESGAVLPGVTVTATRLLPIAGTQTLELRIETFNLFNNFNWGTPVTNFNSGTFGRILTQSGDPRIMQFGVKYGF